MGCIIAKAPARKATFGRLRNAFAPGCVEVMPEVLLMKAKIAIKGAARLEDLQHYTGGDYRIPALNTHVDVKRSQSEAFKIILPWH